MLTMNALDAKDNSDLCLFCGRIFLSGTLSHTLLMIFSMVVIMTLAYVQGHRSKEHQIHPDDNDSFDVSNQTHDRVTLTGSCSSEDTW